MLFLLHAGVARKTDHKKEAWSWQAHNECSETRLRAAFPSVENPLSRFLDYTFTSSFFLGVGQSAARAHLDCTIQGTNIGEIWQDVADEVELEKGEEEGEQVARRRGAMQTKVKLWPAGIIPLGDTWATSSPERAEENWAKVKNGAAFFEEYTCLHFREKTDEDWFWLKADDKGQGCSSSMGWRGAEKQEDGTIRTRNSMQLGPACGPGAVMHEMMHSFGMGHEQTRADRDEYVTVNITNVIDDKVHNFNKKGGLYEDAPYDLASLMHYSAYAFAKDRKFPTISNRLDGKIVLAGNRRMPTQQDIDQLNHLYRDECVKPVPKHAPLRVFLLKESPLRCNDIGPQYSSADNISACSAHIYTTSTCKSQVFNWNPTSKLCQCCHDLSKGYHAPSDAGTKVWVVVGPSKGKSIHDGEETHDVSFDGKIILPDYALTFSDWTKEPSTSCVERLSEGFKKMHEAVNACLASSRCGAVMQLKCSSRYYACTATFRKHKTSCTFKRPNELLAPDTQTPTRAPVGYHVVIPTPESWEVSFTFESLKRCTAHFDGHSYDDAETAKLACEEFTSEGESCLGVSSKNCLPEGPWLMCKRSKGSTFRKSKRSCAWKRD